MANWFINARVRIWRPEVDKHGLGDAHRPRAVQVCVRARERPRRGRPGCQGAAGEGTLNPRPETLDPKP